MEDRDIVFWRNSEIVPYIRDIREIQEHSYHFDIFRVRTEHYHGWLRKREFVSPRFSNIRQVLK